MKKIPRKLKRYISTGETRISKVMSKHADKWSGFGIAGARSAGDKRESRRTLFVAVNKSWSKSNSANVLASTNQEENDEQQRLEIEERGLKPCGPGA
jgi:hypothetical protein